MYDDPNRTAAVQHMMRRVDGFARGLGLDEAAAHQIVEKIAAEMPGQSDNEQLDAARQRMIIASS